MKFSPGDTVMYKGKKYVIIMTPLTFKFKVQDDWVSGYLYTSFENGNGYARETSDLEAKFKLSSV